MVRNRTGARTPVPGALDRLADQIAGFRDEMRADLGRLHDRVDQVDARVDQTSRAASEDLLREVSHLNARVERFSEAAARGMEQVRQELKDHEKATTADVTRAAVQGVLSSKAVLFRPNRLQFATLLTMVAIFLMTFIEKAPPIFRAVGMFFEGVKKLDAD